MMKRTLVFVFTMVLLTAVGCSKDEDNNNLLVGKWEQVKTVWVDGSLPDDEFAPGEHMLEFTANGRVYEYQNGEKSPYSVSYSYDSKTGELTLFSVIFKVEVSADELIMHGQSIDVTPAPYADYYRRIE